MEWRFTTAQGNFMRVAATLDGGGGGDGNKYLYSCDIARQVYIIIN